MRLVEKNNVVSAVNNNLSSLLYLMTMDTTHLDKLEKRLSDSTTDIERLHALRALVEHVSPLHPDRALPYAKEGFEIAERTGDRHLIGEALHSCATVYNTLRDFTTSTEYFRRAREIFYELGNSAMLYKSQAMMAIGLTRAGELSQAIALLDECRQYWESVNNRHEQAIVISFTGQAFYNLGDYPAAVARLLEAVEVLEEAEDWRRVCQCYNFLGVVYAALREVAMIRHYFDKHLAAANQWGYLPEQIGALQNLMVWCNNENRPDEALAFYRQAEALDPRHEFIHTSLVLASIYSQKGEYRKALRVCHEELKKLMSHNQKRDVMNTLFMMGHLYELSGQVTRVIQIYEQIAEISQDIGNTERLLESYLRCAQFCETKKRYRLATQYFSKYTKLRRDAEEQEKQKVIAELQAKFDVQSAEREKELFRVKNVELTGALDEVRRLNENLTKLNDEKNEVLGIVAHDLKSPLSGVRMVASLVKEHYRHMPEAEVEKQLETIVDSTERMLLISSNLLRAQRIETGDVFGVSERVEVCGIVQRLVESYRSVAKEKQITIEFAGEPVIVVCSEEALRQAVENLISNAVKFTPHRQRVRVSVKKRGSKALVEVSDEGPGISKSERKKLYGKYSRLSARPTGGESTTGLGLWIAKKAVEAIHGRIRCTSEPGSGTTFRIELSYS